MNGVLRRTARRAVPRTALGQIVAIIAAALVATFGVSFALLFVLAPLFPPRPVEPIDNVLAVAQAVQVLDAVPPAQRPTLLPALSSAHFHVALPAAAQRCGPDSDASRAMADRLRPLLPAHAGTLETGTCQPQDGPGGVMQVLAPLAGAATADIRLESSGRPDPIALSVPFLVGLLFLVLAAAVLSIWAAWRVTRPLRGLARTAETFGRDIVIAPLPEDGPQEIRQVAHAFNQMQERIAAFVRDRTRMLAAVSHDLRTPLTRLKLRVEIEVPGEARARMLDDIGQLQAMIGSALAFLRGQTVVEERDRIDLGALVATICDEFDEGGAPVACTGEQSLACLCQPLAVRRALNNLIENARSYGTNVEVNLRRACNEAVIEVADDGPGIPDALKQAALQPFTRLDGTRPATKGNMGLGLAIVADIARLHGGRFELADRLPHGLVARLVLPAKSP